MAPGPVKLIAYAQNAEDIVLMRAFEHQPAGFYVDIGAGHPTEGSLTKNLYDRSGWRGINLEPHPGVFAELAAARLRDINYQCAIGSRPGRAAFGILTGNWGMSSLDAGVVGRHIQNGWEATSIEVEVIRLETILTKYAKPNFDMLKIDVEGREADVLASFDLCQWTPRVLVIEATAPGTTVPSHREWEPAVLKCGYQLALFDGLNRFYARRDEPDLLSRLMVPANVFDRYIHYQWWKLLPSSTQAELLT
ncbi:MAG TPA: FkbM family methyltransferase [Candidatus Saccharimonadales bacterium]|nr:FkbM family methyltransferase [Candidatus Saccharimonadales bacterium]